MGDKRIRKYISPDIDVTFDVDLCIHVSECTDGPSGSILTPINTPG